MAIKLHVFFLSIIFVFAAVCTSVNVWADILYKEAVFVAGYSDRDQWIGNKDRGIKNAVGFEYYKKFSDEYGDFLTLNIQMRIGYDFNENRSDEVGVEIHNAWLEHKLGLGKTIRLGHFDPAFGLEPVLDTHGTLLQTLALKNIGFKKDWGIGYKGLLGDFDYQIAVQFASGMGIRRTDSSYLMTGRISTPQTRDVQIGLSFLSGQTLASSESWTIPAPELISEETVKKTRIGIDLQCPLWFFDFKAEIAAGENEGTTVAGGMAEFAYTVPKYQNLRLKMQTLYWSNDWEEKHARDLTLSPVIEIGITPEMTIRLGYFHDIDSIDPEDKKIVFQFYYFAL